MHQEDSSFAPAATEVMSPTEYFPASKMEEQGIKPTNGELTLSDGSTTWKNKDGRFIYFDKKNQKFAIITEYQYKQLEKKWTEEEMERWEKEPKSEMQLLREKAEIGLFVDLIEAPFYKNPDQAATNAIESYDLAMKQAGVSSIAGFPPSIGVASSFASIIKGSYVIKLRDARAADSTSFEGYDESMLRARLLVSINYIKKFLEDGLTPVTQLEARKLRKDIEEKIREQILPEAERFFGLNQTKST